MRQHFLWGAAALAAGVIGLSAGAGAATYSLNRNTTTVDDCELQSGNGGGWDNLTNFSWGVLGYKDMFTLVPPTSGSDAIVIDSAVLNTQVAGTTDPGGDQFHVYRMITNWMTKPAAGDSENNVSYALRDITGNVAWAGGGSFSTADYDVASDKVGGPILDTYYDTALPSLDVTSIVQTMYATGVNNGFAVYSGSRLRSSERGGSVLGPELVINYHYAPVPEPASLGLLALGGLGLLARRRTG